MDDTDEDEELENDHNEDLEQYYFANEIDEEHSNDAHGTITKVFYA